MVGFNRFDVTAQITAKDKCGQTSKVEMRIPNASAEDLQAIQRFQDVLKKNITKGENNGGESPEICILLHGFWSEEGNPKELQPLPAEEQLEEGKKESDQRDSFSEMPDDTMSAAWETLKNSKLEKTDFWNFSREVVQGDDTNEYTVRLLLSALSGYVLLNPEIPAERRRFETLKQLLAENGVEELGRLFYSKPLPEQLKIASDAYSKFTAASPTIQYESKQRLEKLLGEG